MMTPQKTVNGRVAGKLGTMSWELVNAKTGEEWVVYVVLQSVQGSMRMRDM